MNVNYPELFDLIICRSCKQLNEVAKIAIRSNCFNCGVEIKP